MAEDEKDEFDEEFVQDFVNAMRNQRNRRDKRLKNKLQKKTDKSKPKDGVFGRANVLMHGDFGRNMPFILKNVGKVYLDTGSELSGINGYHQMLENLSMPIFWMLLETPLQHVKRSI